MTNKKIFIIFIISLLLTSCFKSKKDNIKYNKFSLKTVYTKKIDYTDRLTSITVKVGENIYIYSINKGIYKINISNNTSKLLFKVGVGPEEIRSLNNIVYKNNYCWMNSNTGVPYIYRFNPNEKKPKLERIKMKILYGTDDIEPLNNNKIAVTNVYWKDGAIKIYDNNGKTYLSCGKPKFIELMNKFNINVGNLYSDKKNLYFIQSIIPEIQVFNYENGLLRKKIKLNPPFYEKPPEKYNIEKYNNNGHKQWMSQWTPLNNIMGLNNLILLRYRRGYENKLYYELLDLENTNKRYYFLGNNNLIINMSLSKDNDIIFGILQESNEGLIWKESKLVF